jgi:hypothetical protein
MIEIFSNNAQTTLATSLPASGAGSTTVQVASGTGALFPVPGTVSLPVGATSFFRMSLTDAATQTKHEIVYVTAASGDTFTVVRGQDGTSAQAWDAGDICGQFVVAGTDGNQLQIQQAQAGYLNYAVGSGSVNVLAATFNPMALQALTPGVAAEILVPWNNSGSVTFALNGFGAQPVVNKFGLALSPNELINGVIYRFVWSGTKWVVGGANSPSPYWTDTSGTANQITVTSGLNLTGFAKGDVVFVRVANTNTSSVFIAVDGGSNIAVLARDASTLQASVMLQSYTIRLVYNGSAFISDLINNPTFVIGEVRMWSGNPSNISTAWGPGWQLANGTNGTPNLLNQFIVGAGSTYTVGQTGGSATNVLVTANLPAHNHGITDPGHNHTISDPGHAHSVYDPGHNHGISQSPHAHGVSDPGHSHGIPKLGSAQAGSDNGGVAVPVSNGYGTSTTISNTYASGTGIGIQAQYANVSNVAAATGIGIYGNTTGITNVANTTGITTTNTGSGTAVNGLPPYYALCFVTYIG